MIVSQRFRIAAGYKSAEGLIERANHPSGKTRFTDYYWEVRLVLEAAQEGLSVPRGLLQCWYEKIQNVLQSRLDGSNICLFHGISVVDILHCLLEDWLLWLNPKNDSRLSEHFVFGYAANSLLEDPLWDAEQRPFKEDLAGIDYLERETGFMKIDYCSVDDLYTRRC
jgi:hypothetical protein